MKLHIIQGGQRGVDRGAWRGAREGGLLMPGRGGWGPHDMRDELGPIPAEVAADLTPCPRYGYAERTRANVFDCDAVLLIVQDFQRPFVTRGTALTNRVAEQLGRQAIVTDEARMDGALVVIRAIVRRSPIVIHTGNPRPVCLMVAGPRGSLWPEGEEVARRAVLRIADAIR